MVTADGAAGELLPSGLLFAACSLFITKTTYYPAMKRRIIDSVKMPRRRRYKGAGQDDCRRHVYGRLRTCQARFSATSARRFTILIRYRFPPAHARQLLKSRPLGWAILFRRIAESWCLLSLLLLGFFFHANISSATRSARRMARSNGLVDDAREPGEQIFRAAVMTIFSASIRFSGKP